MTTAEQDGELNSTSNREGVDPIVNIEASQTKNKQVY